MGDTFEQPDPTQTAKPLSQGKTTPDLYFLFVELFTEKTKHGIFSKHYV